MAYERLTDDLDIISGLVDEPNDIGGLSAEELKAKFDEAGNVIKHYINDVFLPEIEGQNGAENIGITGISQISQATNVQDALIRICSLISDISQGAVPDGSIVTAKLANAAVTAAKLAALAVETASIANGAVTADKLAELAVGTANIINKAVTSSKIADGAVGTNQLDTGAVTNIKISTGAIQTDNIYDGAVTNAKLGNGSVTNAKLGNGSVTYGKLSNGSVTAEKIAANAVTTVYHFTVTPAMWMNETSNNTCLCQRQPIEGMDENSEFLIDLEPRANDASIAEGLARTVAWRPMEARYNSSGLFLRMVGSSPTIDIPIKIMAIRK